MDPTGDELAFLVRDRPTLGDLSTMRQTERRIIEFWNGLDRHLGMREGVAAFEDGGEMAAIFQELLAAKHFLSHPSQSWYYADAESDGDSAANAMEQMTLGGFFSVVDSALVTNGRPAGKTKTRPDIAVVDPALVEPPRTPPEADAPPPIQLKRRDYNIFEVLFSQRCEGTMAWTDFCHAMVGAGCAMVPTFGGSARAFSKGGLGAVHFHEPHEAKIGRVKLIAMAGDLRNHFQWSLESFVSE